MAVKISGTTVIDDSRNIINVIDVTTANTVSSNNVIVSNLKDTSNRTLVIRDAANNIIWGG